MTRATVVMLLPMLITSSCKQSDSVEHASPSSPARVASATPMSADSHTGAHDPSSPPIDCPLRKAGIDPHGMKPFDQVEKYIAFLERADRMEWQKPDDVVRSLSLSGTETVADLGAGSGYFSFRFAKALPKGHVVAIDVEPEMIRHIHHQAMMEGVNNVAVQFAKPDDPTVPNDADWVFICDVLHHVKDRPAWLARMHEEMKSGAKVALIEFKEGELPEGPPEALKLPKKTLLELMATAGFTLIDEKKDLLPYQHVLIFQNG